MQRITIKFLNAQCDRLNRITNSPMESYSRAPDGRFTANVGCFHISQAYGGFALHRMHNTGGGVSSPLGGGHMPARELSERISAYIAGLNDAKDSM